MHCFGTVLELASELYLESNWHKTGTIHSIVHLPNDEGIMSPILYCVLKA